MIIIFNYFLKIPKHLLLSKRKLITTMLSGDLFQIMLEIIKKYSHTNPKYRIDYRKRLNSKSMLPLSKMRVLLNPFLLMESRLQNQVGISTKLFRKEGAGSECFVCNCAQFGWKFSFLSHSHFFSLLLAISLVFLHLSFQLQYHILFLHSESNFQKHQGKSGKDIRRWHLRL